MGTGPVATPSGTVEVVFEVEEEVWAWEGTGEPAVPA